MKAFFSILVVLILLGLVFFIFDSTTSKPLEGTPEDEIEATRTDSVFAEPSTWSAVNNKSLTENWFFSVKVPTQVQLNNPQSSAYTFKYIGPESEAATEITDGFYLSLTAYTDTTLEQYLQENNVADTATPSTFNGYTAQSYATRSELGDRSVPHTAFELADGTTVIDITQSYYGDQTSEYQRVGQLMLNTLTFSQNEDSESAPVIKVQSPQAGDSVSSPIAVSGEARGYWFFEATAPVSVKNNDGTVIGEGYIEAEGNWMTEEFVPFSGTISYTQEPNPTEATGTVVFHRANPSGLSENDASLAITVQLDENSNE